VLVCVQLISTRYELVMSIKSELGSPRKNLVQAHPLQLKLVQFHKFGLKYSEIMV
jgi:hypothetical protein